MDNLEIAALAVGGVFLALIVARVIAAGRKRRNWAKAERERERLKRLGS